MTLGLKKSIPAYLAINMAEQKKILVVDDESEVLEFIKVTLEKFGYSFLGAENAELGYQQMEKNHPDLALLDVMLPDTDGISLCRRIKANPQMKNIPVLIITSLMDPKTIQEAYLSGAYGYVSKPFDEEQLKNKISKALDLNP